MNVGVWNWKHQWGSGSLSNHVRPCSCRDDLWMCSNCGKGGGWLNCDVGSTSLHHVLDKWCPSPELIHCTIATTLGEKEKTSHLPHLHATYIITRYNHPGMQWNTQHQISTRAFPLGAGPPPCSKYSGMVVSWSFLCVRVLPSSFGVCLNWPSSTYPAHFPSNKFNYMNTCM